jgi:hypothetical protein
MATWEVDMTGLQIVEEDGNGWPVTRVVPLTMRFEEDNVIRLHKTAKKEAEEQFPGYYDYAFNGIVRLDRRTNKDYGFGQEEARPAYRLSPSQQKDLRRMKGEIFHKFVGDELLRNPLALLGRDASVNRPGGGVAWLSDQSGIFTHEEAEKVIKALQRFYSRISREELAILRMHDAALSHEDLEVVRAYIGATPAAA